MSETKRSPSLQIAVEEQGSRTTAPPLALRNRLIANALAEGESVADVATALGMTEAAIYKVQQGLQLSHSASDADLRMTGERLESFTDHVAFERLIAVLMADVEPRSVPMGGVADRGRDGATPDGKVVWTISLAKQWTRKVRSDLARIREEGFRPRKVYAVTNRRTSRKAAEALEQEAGEQGIDLTILDQRWLVAKLTHPGHVDLRSTYLGLARPHARTFLSAAEYRELLDGRPHLFGFDTEFIGREKELRRAGEMLEQRGAILLAGAGGLGKTRLALQMADPGEDRWYFLGDASSFEPGALSEIEVTPQTTIVIDNAHRRRDLRQLVAALGDLAHRPRLVLIARPGFTDFINRELSGLWVEPIEVANTIVLEPLSWQTMSELLQTPSLNVQSEGMRGTLIQLAEGNPQIAVIGATVARERRSVSELSSAGLLQSYVIYLIPTAIPAGTDSRELRRLLAVSAALGGIDASDETLLEDVAGISRSSLNQVQERLELLADGGLVVLEGTTYKIKPDLLAEHVLFALTLSDKWEPVLPYETIFERFAPRYLDRLVRALGELPPGLIDDEIQARLWPVEQALDRSLHDGDPLETAGLIRDIARAFPDIAFPRCQGLLRKQDEADGELPHEAMEALLEAALRLGDFSKRWKLLLSLSAASVDRSPQIKKLGEAMADVYQYLPEDGSENAGRVLAWVQHMLAQETKQFWRRRPAGAAVAVALSVRPMLTLAFDVSRQSADNPMSITLGSRFLPESTYTKEVVQTGAQLAIEVFPLLDPPWQLKLLETLSNANHAASGYQLSYGARLETWARVLLDRALSCIDAELAASLSDLPMPVQAEAYSYLLKRVKARERLLKTLEEERADAREGERADNEEKLSSQSAPAPSAELQQYVFLIRHGEVGPPNPRRFLEEQDQMAAMARTTADLLLDSTDWRRRLDRWSEWCRQTREFTGELRFGPGPALVLQEVARRNLPLAREAIDYLIETESDLRGATAPAMTTIIEAGDESAIESWLAADSTVKAALASALAGSKRPAARAAMRKLVLSDEEPTRAAALQSLSFSRSLDKADIDLGLEALMKVPEIEGLSRLLHMADHHAEAEGKPGYEFDQEQREMVKLAALGTARNERLGDYGLAEMLERAAQQLPCLPIDWTLARLDFLADFRPDETRPWRWWGVDELPEEIRGLVQGAAKDGDLEALVERLRALPDDSYALADTATAIGWLGAGADSVTDLIIELLDKGGRSYSALRALMRVALPDELFDRRAERIANSVDAPLNVLLELLDDTLPTFWSGSRVPHLESALDHAKRWADSKDPALREAGRQVLPRFQRRVETERLNEEADDRRFEYR